MFAPGAAMNKHTVAGRLELFGYVRVPLKEPCVVAPYGSLGTEI